MVSTTNCAVNNAYEMVAAIAHALSNAAWPVALVIVAWLIYRKGRTIESGSIEIIPPQRKGK